MHAYTVLGFSAGARNCIGKQLAHLEVKIAVIKMIQRYSSFSLESDDLTLKVGMLYESEDFKIIFSKNQ